MPIIIDANVADECLIPSEDAKPIMAKLIKGKIECVTGHTHKREMLSCRFRKIYRQLLLAGRLKEYPDDEIEAAERALPSPQASNDAHILALAQVSGARILFSRDQPLHQDFTDARFLSSPRGRVYQSATHHLHLLEPQYC